MTVARLVAEAHAVPPDDLPAVEEALAGVTREAGRALGLAGRRGVLAEGAEADLAIWSVPHPASLVYEPMAPRIWQRVLGGEIVA